MGEVSLKKRIWGWYFFDWASQPYHTVLNTFTFGPFFGSIAVAYFVSQGLDDAAADARAQSLWAWTLGFIGVFIAMFAPIFGAMADSSGRRMPWIVGFSALYVLGAFGLWFTDPGASNLYLMLVVFGIGFIGAEWALIFVNAQLPGLGTAEEVGSISGTAFAFGYLGGVVCLALALLLFIEQDSGTTLIGLDPILGLDASAREGTRAVGPLVAIWFALFMIPYFLWVRETRTAARASGVGAALGSVWATVRSLRHKRSLLNFLLGSMLFRDGLNGLYMFGGFYAGLMLDWSITQIGVFGVIAALGAAVISYLGGMVDRRVGPKPVVVGAIWVLIGVSLTVINITPTAIYGIAVTEGSGLPDALFMVCGVLIGGMGGALQSSSRCLMCRHADEATSTEYFGLYGLSGRATAFLAPLLIGAATTASGSVQIGVSPIILLLVAGLVLLRWVNKDGE